MKVSVEQAEVDFKPLEYKVTLHTAEEVEKLWLVFTSACITSAARFGDATAYQLSEPLYDELDESHDTLLEKHCQFLERLKSELASAPHRTCDVAARHAPEPIKAAFAKSGVWYESAKLGRVLCCGTSGGSFVAFAVRVWTGATKMRYLDEEMLVRSEQQSW